MSILKIDEIRSRYIELEKALTDPKTLADKGEIQRRSKEFKRIGQILQKYESMQHLEKSIVETKELKKSSDKELVEMAEIELMTLEKQHTKLKEEIVRLSAGRPDEESERNCIIEIRAGAGGEEAALFAADLFRMYTKYVERKNLKWEMLASHPTGLGGLKEVIFSVEGGNSFNLFKYESGVHRVQRIPETEAAGRKHTSTVTVAVLPEVEEVEYHIDENDLKIDTFRASGHGGQNVNKVSSAVRITHLPSNIVVTCQDERSQHRNREKAMKILRAKLLDIKRREQEREISQQRKEQVGTGDRSEKIRTYNFPQNRVTDHRAEISLYNLEDILDGDLDKLIRGVTEKLKTL